MRLLSFTMLFRIVMSATLPLGSFNRLSLHVMGLSPNSKAQNTHILSSSLHTDTATAAAADVLKDSESDAQECSSPPSSEVAKFPSLATVFDCRGGHSMHPIEDALKPASLPIRVLGMELSLFGLKLLLQLGLTALNVACWWLPMRTKSFSRNDNLMALANTFSAGIFLMLAFTHLIPHALHTMENANINPMFAFQATVVGYLVIFAIEKLFFDSHHILHEVEGGKPGLEEMDTGRLSNVSQSSQTSSDDGGDRSPTRPRASSVVSQQSAVVLMLAMAVHSLFETVALGMAPDRTSAIILASSVALHQPAESLALLVAFLKTSMERKVIMRWLGLFSIIGPFGVFLGRFIQALASPMVEGFLVAMTAGTFLYVGTTEIIPESFEDDVPSGEKWKRFAALVGGIGSIMLIGGDDHDHDHGHH